MSETQPQKQQNGQRQQQCQAQEQTSGKTKKTRQRRKRGKKGHSKRTETGSAEPSDNKLSLEKPQTQQKQQKQSEAQEQIIGKTQDNMSRGRGHKKRHSNSTETDNAGTSNKLINKGNKLPLERPQTQQKQQQQQREAQEQTVGESKTNNAGTGAKKLSVERQPLNSIEEKKMKISKPVTPVASRKAAGSNWEAARGKAVPADDNKNQANGETSAAANQTPATLSKAQRHRQKRRAAQQKYVAMDCEMVGVGLNGQDDMLARVSIVNKLGEVLLDKFVKPQETVTDYRTSISGIRPHDIVNGEDMKNVQNEVVQILQGKILIGHSINKDLYVLGIKHPRSNIRDTAFYKPLRRLVAHGRTPSLKRLSLAILGKEIQTGEHSSVEDARAVMSIYNCLAKDWEDNIKRHEPKSNK